MDKRDTGGDFVYSYCTVRLRLRHIKEAKETQTMWICVVAFWLTYLKTEVYFEHG